MGLCTVTHVLAAKDLTVALLHVLYPCVHTASF